MEKGAERKKSLGLNDIKDIIGEFELEKKSKKYLEKKSIQEFFVHKPIAE